jgi:hypothetical protein
MRAYPVWLAAAMVTFCLGAARADDRVPTGPPRSSRRDY